MDAFERNQYLRRIGVTQPLGCSLEGLSALQYAHLCAVPFENLDIIESIPIGLDRRAHYEKIVGRGRGGYCYELNGLYSALLISLGFEVRLLSACVAMADGSFGPPYDHLMLLVDLGNASYLVDVGFGDSFTHPVVLRSGLEQSDRNALYMVLRLDGEWALCRKNNAGPWETMLLFSLAPRELADFQERCSWTQNSAESHFVGKALCTRLTKDGRKTLSGMRMIVTNQGHTVETTVETEAERRGRLAQDFGVILP